MVTVEIDQLTPCLKDFVTGDILETEVLRIKRKSFLDKFNKKTGWYVNWGDLAKDTEVYALVIKGTVDIQGLISLEVDRNSEALYVTWMVAAPQNNSEICGKNNQRYLGVGGHLFAIAIMKSVEYGYGGAIYGFANSKERLQHYIKWFHAEHIGILHELHFLIADKAVVRIVEEYNYEWSDDEL